MDVYSVNRSTQTKAERNLYLHSKMQWRITRYGQPCLTAREREAMEYEMYVLSQLRGQDVRAVAATAFIAGKMGVSHQRVSVLLKNAAWVMEYFDTHGVCAQWERLGRGWRLNAPTHKS